MIYKRKSHMIKPAIRAVGSILMFVQIIQWKFQKAEALKNANTNVKTRRRWMFCHL